MTQQELESYIATQPPEHHAAIRAHYQPQVTAAPPAPSFGAPAAGTTTYEDRAPTPQELAALDQGIAGARMGNDKGRELPEPGSHVVDLTGCRFLPKTFYGPRWVFEFVLVESTCPDAEIGGEYSWAIDPNDQYGYGKNDINAIVGRVVQLRGYSGPPASWVLGPENPVKGVRFSCTSELRTFKTGNSKTMLEHWECLGLASAGVTKGFGRASAPAPAPAGTPPAQAPAGPPPGMAPAPAAGPAWTPPPAGGLPFPHGPASVPVTTTLPWNPPAQAPAAPLTEWGPRPAGVPAHLPWPPVAGGAR